MGLDPSRVLTTDQDIGECTVHTAPAACVMADLIRCGWGAGAEGQRGVSIAYRLRGLPPLYVSQTQASRAEVWAI